MEIHFNRVSVSPSFIVQADFRVLTETKLKAKDSVGKVHEERDESETYVDDSVTAARNV